MKYFFNLTLLLLLYPFLYGQNIPDSSVLDITAPEHFIFEFNTSKGKIEAESYREWSPEGVDRVYQLIQSGFFDSTIIFRVQPEYVCQFGISRFPEVNKFWNLHPLKDEPVVMSNVKGSMAFARGEPETRTTQLFFNMQDNPKLDTINFYGLAGFPIVAQIIEGDQALFQLESKYGFEPANWQDSISMKGNLFLDEKFPGLDYIIDAKIIENK